MLKRYLEVGRIVTVHGVKGEVKVQPWCDSPDFIKYFKTLYFDAKGEKSVKVLSCRTHGNSALLLLEGVSTPEEGVLLRNKVLYMDRNDAPEQDGWYVQDVIGCEVFDSVDENKRYGRVSDVTRTGANDVWTVRTDDGREYLVPVIESVVKLVDPPSGIITISPLKGIFD